MRNTDPLAPRNDPIYRDDHYAPHNDPYRSNDPWEPWNDRAANETDLEQRDRDYYR